MKGVLHNAILASAGLAFCLLACVAGAATETDEKAVWDAWKAHLGASNNHVAAATVAQQALAAVPTNPLAPVIRGLIAWHVLQAGQTNAAVTALEPLLSAETTPLEAAGAEMARRWLSRADREKVRWVLARYYRDHVEYPPSLEPLKKGPKDTLPPLADRWQTPWDYRQSDFKALKGLTGQKYVLQSKKLGAASDLAAALALPYAGRMAWKPVGAVGANNITFEIGGEKPQKVPLSEGASLEGVTFAYAGLKILILCDGDYWLVLPRPR